MQKSSPLVYLLLFFLANQHFIVAQDFTITETYVVCAGESVFLPAAQDFPQPPIPPAGPDNPTGIGGIPCTPQLNQISILPADNSLAEEVRGFTVTPTASAVYTVISKGLCGGPGSSEFGELAVQYEVVIDATCEVLEQEPPSSSKDTFIVCAGASVFLPAAQEFQQPPLPPAGPNDPNGVPVTPCTPQLNQISILPTANTLAEGVSGFTVTPTVTDSYTVTSNGLCGGPGTAQTGEIKLTYHVIVDATCSSPASPSEQLFSDFPWLTDLTTTDCEVTSIVVYEKGGYHYVLVTDQEEQQVLYFQDGTAYCQSTADYDCVAAYSLETTVNSWTCEDQGTPPPTQEVAIFTDFPWLARLIDINNCTTESVILYEEGNYQYLLVTDENGQETLYFQDGSMYCQSAADYDCVAAYGLSTVGSTWTCSGGTSLTIPTDYSIGSEPPVTKVFDYTACTGDVLDLLVPNFGACPLDLPASTEIVEVLELDQQFLTVRILSSGSFTFASIPSEDCANVTHIYSFVIQPTCTVDPIFSDFPWLSTHVDPTRCNGEEISLYEVNGYQYVFVATPEGNTLYFQNGDLYCTDAPNYDCRTAYNLGSPTSTWSCTVSGLVPLLSTQRSTTLSDGATTLKLFPNPAQHTFNVLVEELDNEIQHLQLVDVQGRILQTIAIPAGKATRTIGFDITTYAEGVYFVNLLSKGERRVQRIVKQQD